MFQVTKHSISSQVQRLQFSSNGTLLSTNAVLTLLRDNVVFRDVFIEALLAVSYQAFRWETPCLTTETLENVFECVVVDSPRLERPASQRFFAEHFANTQNDVDVIQFPNLGGDALLVVPTPQAVDSAYTHIASFTRFATLSQNHALWQCIGALALERCGDKPIWLNTAGGGVPWLHVRLDSRPKYYRHAPYKISQ